MSDGDRGITVRQRWLKTRDDAETEEQELAQLGWRTAHPDSSRERLENGELTRLGC